MIIRDSTGAVSMAKTRRVEQCFSPDIAEAVACRLRLQLAIDQSLTSVVMETDSLMLLQKLAKIGRAHV